MPSCPVDFRNIRTARSVSVSAIVILPVGSKDPERAVQPTKMNSPGGARCATFPLSALSEANEVRFVYEREVCCRDQVASECAVRFNLDGVR